MIEIPQHQSPPLLHLLQEKNLNLTHIHVYSGQVQLFMARKELYLIEKLLADLEIKYQITHNLSMVTVKKQGFIFDQNKIMTRVFREIKKRDLPLIQLTDAKDSLRCVFKNIKINNRVQYDLLQAFNQ